MSKNNNSNQKQPVKEVSIKEVAVKEINKDDLVDFFNNAINTKYRPNKLKKGDVVVSMVAFKLRPCVIIGVEKNNVYAIPLSTTQDDNNLCQCKGRFFGDNSYFSKSIVSISYESALKLFKGCYDNPKHLNLVISQLKSVLVNI